MARRTEPNDHLKLAAGIRRAYEGRLKQVDLAKALGKTQTTISRWALGKVAPTVEELWRIEDACDRPRGFILQAAGLIPEGAGVEDAIEADPNIPDSLRAPLIGAYRAMVDGHSDHQSNGQR